MTAVTPRRLPGIARAVAAACAVAGACAGCGPAVPVAVRASPPPSCPRQVYGAMTEAQRVGQLFLVGMPESAAARAVASYHFGAVLLTGEARAPAAAVARAAASIQSLATARATAGVEFLIAANQEGGAVQALAGPGFTRLPAALDQGALPPATLRQDAARWGSQLRAAGVNLNLAPVMDVVPAATAARNAPIGQLRREFGADPATVGAHGAAFIEGMARAGVATTAKHFPGLGRVTGNTDFTAGVTDTVTTADDPALGSFKAAVDAGAGFVMVALATYARIDPRHLAVFSPEVIRILRQRLGFRGVVISDDLGQAAAVAGIPAADRAAGFLNAGGDMISSQLPGPAETMASAVLARADASTAFRAEVAAAVIRILAAKQSLGLLPC